MMRRVLAVLSFCGWLVACTALMSHEPVIRQAGFPEPPDVAYARALRTMARMGGALTHADAQSRSLSATVHHAATLTVVVLPMQGGSAIEVTGTLLPNKVAFGSFTEVQDYIALLQED